MLRHLLVIGLVVACNKDKAAEERSVKDYSKSVDQSYKDVTATATAEPKKPAAPLPLSAAKPRALEGLTPALQIDVPDDVAIDLHKGAGKPDVDAAVISWHDATIYVTAGDPAADVVKKELKGTVQVKQDDAGWVMTASDGASSTVAVYRKQAHALCKASLTSGNSDDVVTICSTLRPR